MFNKRAHNPETRRDADNGRLLPQLTTMLLLMIVLPITITLVILASLLFQLRLRWQRLRHHGGRQAHRSGHNSSSWHMRSPWLVKSRLSVLFHEMASILLSPDELRALLELRNRHYLLFDLLALSLTPAVALTIRVEDLSWWPQTLPALVVYTTVSVVVKISIFYFLGLYGRYWRYASIHDMSRLLLSTATTTVMLTACFIIVHNPLREMGLALSRTIPLVDGMLTLLAAGSLRFTMRTFYDWLQHEHHQRGSQNVLIVGAGEAGMLTVREIYANPNLMLEPVGFIDDNQAKLGTHVYGLPVLGTSRDIADVVDMYHIQRIIVAIPSAPLPRQAELAEMCHQTGVATDTLPGIYQILAGHKTISPLPQIDITRILGREPITVDLTLLSPVIRGRRVLVTGAGGSIGSELCRQIAALEPEQLVLLGHGENSIFEIALDLSLRFPNLKTEQVIADVRHAGRMKWAVGTFLPDIIFHTAAHKHVPFMENSVAEALTNNVLGTRNVLRAAEKHGVSRFVLVSTDKAINPVNVMGATKRIAELLTQAAAQRTGNAYIAVRFGNVLGSRGSVVPVFQRQISAGGPVTITHPDMHRYFMTIPEAVSLLLQAAALGEGGEVFVLDMGEPVAILDLAVDLIRLSGLEPGRDIEIVHSGIRPGEKLREELFLASEAYDRSEQNEKLCVAVSQTRPDVAALEQAVDRLLRSATGNATPQLLIEQMQGIVPEYHPDGQGVVRPGAVLLETQSTTLTAGSLVDMEA
jgi:FlaA1/EpsC-like NDP-sugar epimerase